MTNLEIQPTYETQIGNAPSPETITEIRDKLLRKTLIDATLNLEKGVEEGKISNGWKQTFINEMGLGIEIEAKQKDEKTFVFYYAYFMDRPTWNEWLKKHKYMTENGSGLQLCMRGLLFQIVTSGSTILMASYHPNDESNELVGVHLLNDKMTFLVHRDLFNDKEWCVKRMG